jgi:hypothetical protein
MDKKDKNVLKNGIKLTAEMLLSPGSSLLIDGKIKSGLLHVGVGIAAKMALGVPGCLFVAANSFSKSLTGKNLIATVCGTKDSRVVTLVDKVKKNVEQGMTLNETQEDILEDVEDLYMEATVDQQPGQKESR